MDKHEALEVIEDRLPMTDDCVEAVGVIRQQLAVAPAWHDKPTVPGDYAVTPDIVPRFVMPVDRDTINDWPHLWAVRGWRFYGPIPADPIQPNSETPAKQ